MRGCFVQRPKAGTLLRLRVFNEPVREHPGRKPSALRYSLRPRASFGAGFVGYDGGAHSGVQKNTRAAPKAQEHSRPVARILCRGSFSPRFGVAVAAPRNAQKGYTHILHRARKSQSLSRIRVRCESTPAVRVGKSRLPRALRKVERGGKGRAFRTARRHVG